jgi:hypothetical protein
MGPPESETLPEHVPTCSAGCTNVVMMEDL